MDQNYLRENNIYIRKNSYPLVAEIDTIIFDIDGVLVDVHSSFYQTIIDTVQYYFHNIINMPGNSSLMNRSTISQFKMIGGFNNDWELTAAAILYYLWKMKEYGIQSIEKLRDNPPLIDHFIKKDLAYGGGLLHLITWIKENAIYSEEIFSLWNKEKIFQIAKEFYAGEKYCFRLYHFFPQILRQIEGNIEKEVIIIKPEVAEIAKQYHMGILTGRNRTETNVIMEQIAWDSWLRPETIITSEDHMDKPSPDGIEFLMKYFQSRLGLYIGDTMDDLLTVNNLNRSFGKQRCLSALVLGNDFSDKDAKKLYYMEYHVDLLAENVNQVMQFIDHTSLS